jgi:hypothetical protein
MITRTPTSPEPLSPCEYDQAEKNRRICLTAGTCKLGTQKVTLLFPKKVIVA